MTSFRNQYVLLNVERKTLRKVIVAALLGLVASHTTTAAHADTVVVTADNMIDVISGKVVKNPVIVVKDGRISSVSTQKTSEPADARHVDLPGMTLLPGLIDMHVHLTFGPEIGGYKMLAYTDNFWTVMGVANARKTLRAGFTTVRNLGAGNYDDVALKQGIEGGYIEGPRIIPATYMICATGGHCDEEGSLPPNVSIVQPGVVDGPEQIRHAVRTLRKYGAEVIKFAGTGGVMSKTDPVDREQFSLEEMKVLVDEAHRWGMKVAVHAHGTLGINDALRAGVDTIEHASFTDAEGYRLAKANHAWLDMTPYTSNYVLELGTKNGAFQESMAKARMVVDAQERVFRGALAAGVRMIYGTDAGVFPNGDNAKQFPIMVKWGMSPIETLRTATVNAAEALGKEKDVGAIAEGRYGDMIAVRGDPLSDISILQKVAFVMKGGNVVKEVGTEK
ncbi:amidohydrolase family protein [Acetobacter musti]|uniref:Amidohydrolase family protein n=1 Tax=Acetobacter musti TaxID=864732 RepID=A0ABX0JSY5_9PROT|nr:amidohydrolase family protein [Acetobacter musti]